MSESILAKVADGQPAAVDECLSQYGGLVWSLARRMLSNEADAEDAVQDIFIDVWKNASRFDESIASEATFIAMIARRRLIDRRRKIGRTPDTAQLDISQLGEQPNPAIDETEQVAINDEAALARRQMKQLRPEEQQVLNLAIDQGLSQSEIANAIDLPLGTVKTHARRGLMRLRSLLGVNADRVSPTDSGAEADK